MATPTREQVVEYIREAARQRGIDPDVAVAVAESEGLNARSGPAGAFASDVRVGSGTEPSYGAFQLYMGGGLGNEFQRATGLDPRDPANWAQTIDFALDAAAKGGWSPFHGAARVGIGRWSGLKGSKGLGNYASNMGTKNLQAALSAAGFNPGKIDGVMGPRTKEAVRAFQQANGLKVDGVVGPRTMAALRGTSVQTAGNRSFRTAPGINIGSTAFNKGNFLPASDVARFQRDTASMGTGKVSGGKGSYQYTGKARGDVNPALVAAVQAASAAIGKSINITSAIDTPGGGTKRNASSQHMVGKGGKGLGNAFDLSISAFSDQEKQVIAQTLAAHGVTRMGTYSNPDMLHIDMGTYGVREKGKVHFMHNKSIANINAAPAWFRDLYSSKLAVGKPSDAQVQVASNVVNQIREGLKAGKNGIAYAQMSPKSAPGARTFGNTPVGSMPEQMSEGMSTSGFQPAEAAALFQRAKEQAAAAREAKAAQAARERGMNFGAAYAPRASTPIPTAGATTPNVQGNMGAGGRAVNNPAGMDFGAAYGARQEAPAPVPAGMDFGAAYGRREAPVPVPTPAPARQAAVPKSATEFAPGPPSAAQAELARQVAGARSLSDVPVSRQPAMPERFDPKIASPSGAFTPGGMTRSGALQYQQGQLPAQVQAKGFVPDAIPGVTGPPLGTLNSAPGHVTPGSVADEYGMGPGGYGAGFDGQAGVPAPAREVWGWNGREFAPLSAAQIAAYDALGGAGGRGIGRFEKASSFFGGAPGAATSNGLQQAASSFSPMAGIMGIFNGGAASGANPGQEYGQPGYDAMMADPTVRASTEAIMGRPLDGSVRHSTLDPQTGLPVDQPAPTMPGFHMGRIFGAPGAPAAGLGGLLGLGLSAALPGVGGLLGGLLGGRGINVAGLFGGGLGPFGGVVNNIANQAIGAIGKGFSAPAAAGGGTPAGVPAGAEVPSMDIVRNTDRSGRFTGYSWEPSGGGLSPGAAGAGWASNNPERSYGGYGGGYDPTPT